MTEPLNLKQLTRLPDVVFARAHTSFQRQQILAEALHQTITALREARTALLWAKSLHDLRSDVNGPNWADCAALIRATLEGVRDD